MRANIKQTEIERLKIYCDGAETTRAGAIFLIVVTC